MSQKSSSTTLSHLNQSGEAHMVDISGKSDSARLAVAGAQVVFPAALLTQVMQQGIEKGDLFATARIAGIQAAKRCSELIPLCHPLPLNKVEIEIQQSGESILQVTATCKTHGKTGVEMEALTAASVAALTIYDMCKALNKGIVIESLCLLQKSGGKSGDWKRDHD